MAEPGKKRRTVRLPKEHCVTVQSGKWLMMEAVERIVLCSAEKIVLKGAFRLEILGEGLQLQELGNDNMAVRGRIASVSFFEE